MILKISSVVHIRRYDNILSNTYLEKGIQMSIGDDLFLNDDTPNGLLVNKTSPGLYSYTVPLGFIKERGECILNDAVYHMEIISLVINENCYVPFIVKLWNCQTCVGYEYLVATNTVDIKHRLFHNEIRNRVYVDETFIGNLLQYICDSAAFRSQYGYHTFDSSMIPLVPQLNNDELNQRFNSLRMYGSPSIILDEFFSLFYGEDINPLILSHIYGVVSRQLNRIMGNTYTHTYNSILHHSTIQSVVESSKRYYALLELSRIPFDQFSIMINLHPIDGNSNKWCSVDIVSADSMSSLYFPLWNHINLPGFINECCCHFLYYYFSSRYTNDLRLTYYDTIDGTEYRIDKIKLDRSVDEILIVTLYAGDLIFERVYDLIALSLLSPVMSS